MSRTIGTMKQALEVIQGQKAWIYAVPINTSLPTMPGFDREWAVSVELELEAAIAAEEVRRLSFHTSMNRIEYLQYSLRTIATAKFEGLTAVQVLRWMRSRAKEVLDQDLKQEST
jgi:hypothetical protein